MKKIFNVGGLFKVASNAIKTQFGLSALTLEANPTFPAIEYGSWGDPHDSIKLAGISGHIATWDDNGGTTDEILLLYIKTSTADLRIFKNYKTFVGGPALVNGNVRVIYNGSETTYDPDTSGNVDVTYSLGANSSLVMNLYSESWDNENYYNMKLTSSSIENLEKIGGGIATVLRTVAKNTEPATGKPTFWHAGWSWNTSGFNKVAGLSNGTALTKADLIAAASSSPGNSNWDKVAFTWGANSELASLVVHSPRAIAKARLDFSCTMDSATNTVTVTHFNDLPINEYKGTLLKTDGQPVCFSNSTAGGVGTVNHYFTKNVTENPVTFQLVSNLNANTAVVDITSNGTGSFKVATCSREDCDFCDDDNIVAAEVAEFDPLTPPPWVSTQVGFIGGLDFDNVP